MNTPLPNLPNLPPGMLYLCRRRGLATRCYSGRPLEAPEASKQQEQTRTAILHAHFHLSLERGIVYW